MTILLIYLWSSCGVDKISNWWINAKDEFINQINWIWMNEIVAVRAIINSIFSFICIVFSFLHFQNTFCFGSNHRIPSFFWQFDILVTFIFTIIPIPFASLFSFLWAKTLMNQLVSICYVFFFVYVFCVSTVISVDRCVFLVFVRFSVLLSLSFNLSWFPSSRNLLFLVHKWEKCS